MMASAKPSLVVGNPRSEVAKIFGESECGRFFDRFDAEEMKGFVEEIKSNKKLRDYYGTNARKYVVEKFSREKVLNRFRERIEALLED